MEKDGDMCIYRGSAFGAGGELVCADSCDMGAKENL